MARGSYVWLGLVFALIIGIVVGCMVQLIAPAVAKLPGLVLCGGGELELVLRRRTSYGVCSGAEGQLGMATILIVSTLVWTAIATPIGIVLARTLVRRRARR